MTGALADDLAILEALRPAAGAPALSWSDTIQPVPLHRARVAIYTGKPARAKAYLTDADEQFRIELQQRWMVARVAREPLEGELLVTMSFTGCSLLRDRIGRRRRLRRPDLSNLVKSLEDAGNGHLWVDDGQIRILVAELAGWSERSKPNITVHAWRLNGEAA